MTSINVLKDGDVFYLSILHSILFLIKHVNSKAKIDPLCTFHIFNIFLSLCNLTVIDDAIHKRISIYIINTNITTASTIWVVFSCCITMGYQFTRDKKFTDIGVFLNTTSKLNTFFILNLIMAIVDPRTLVFFGSSIVKLFILVRIFGILFFARIWAKNDDAKYRGYALILYFVQTYLALRGAFLREHLIMPTVCLMIGYFLGKGKIRYIFSYRILPFCIPIGLFIIAFKDLQANRSSFITVYEEKYFADDDELKQIGKNNTMLMDTVGQAEHDRNTGAFSTRNSNIAQLTQTVRLVNENGFYHGLISAPLLLAIIPRSLWPGKPIIVLGRWFAMAIFSKKKIDPRKPEDYERASNSINMTIPGELYLDFGWLGIMLGSFLYGALFPLLWNASNFYKSEYNLTGTLMGGYLLIIATSGFGADLQIVITIMSSYLSMYFIKRFLLKK